MFKKLPQLVLAIMIVFSVAVLIAGCGNDAGQNRKQGQEEQGEELTGTLQINGSTTVTPVVQAWAERFHDKHPGVEIIVSGTGSGNGIADLINGSTDIAMASRKMKDSEKSKIDDPREFVVGRDGLAVIVHPDNPVDSLSMEEIKGIFTGEITNWEEVGGKDSSINVYTRDTSSGTYGFFKDFVLDGEEYLDEGRKTSSNSAMAESIAQEKTAIGYCGMAFLDDSIKGLSISTDNGEPVKPTFEAAGAGDYPIVRDLNVYTNGEPKGLAKEFLDFGFSSEGQSIVEEVEYIPVN